MVVCFYSLLYWLLYRFIYSLFLGVLIYSLLLGALLLDAFFLASRAIACSLAFLGALTLYHFLLLKVLASLAFACSRLLVVAYYSSLRLLLYFFLN